MALHKVMLPNDYFAVNEFVEEFDGVMQKVRVRQEKGRLRFGGNNGICIPADKVRPFTVKILARGFDDVGAHATLRGKNAGH